MISVEKFRYDFPEFGDTSKFPDAVVAFYINLAGLTMNVDRWGASAVTTWPTPLDATVLTLYDSGVELFVAHNLSLGYQAGSAEFPGLNSMGVKSEQLGPISVTYGAAGGAGAEDGSGAYGLTSYGMRYWRLAQMVGAGPIQVGYDPRYDYAL